MRNRDLADPEYARRLERFAAIAAPDSPLSAAFARAAANDPISHEILSGAPASLPAANVLLAAVQYLLLSGVDDDLADHYPSIARTPTSQRGDPGEQFLAFCRNHRGRIAELVSSRGVQTNEVRRCVVLVPALAGIGEGPLALVEIGASGGLNLCFDCYRYDFGGALTGPDSPLTLTTEIRSGAPPIPDPLPAVAWRVGIDLEPIDFYDPDAVLWARALIWPEQLDRIARFKAAMEIVRLDPPPIIRGDALEVLPGVLKDAPTDATLVVFHSFVLNQFTPEGREQFDTVLRDASDDRAIHRVSFEILRPELAYPEVVHTVYRNGEATDRLLGRAHQHGAWLEWAE